MPLLPHDDHHRQLVANERVDVHQREAGGAVAEHHDDLRVGTGDAGGDRVAHAGAETAVGAGVEPATRLVRVDVLAGVRHEVAAVAHHDRVAVESPAHLAVHAGRS